MVGECDLGCNYGAKNTLDYNYLTAAWRAGAEIRTRSEVRSFEPRDGGGYVIHYVQHDPAREGESTDTGALPQLSVSADRLVLSAGTLGTTYLLLKNRAAFPGLAPAWALVSRATATCSPSRFDAARSGRTGTACRGGSRRATGR